VTDRLAKGIREELLRGRTEERRVRARFLEQRRGERPGARGERREDRGAGQGVVEYVRQFDRGLAAAGLQSIALPSQALDALATKGSESLKQCAAIFQKINGILFTVTTNINKQLNDIPILKLILTPEIQTKINSLTSDLSDDAKALQKIQDSVIPVDRLNAAVRRIEQPA